MAGTSIPFIVTILWVNFKKIAPTLDPLLKNFGLYNKLKQKIGLNNMGRKLLLLYTVLVLCTLGTFMPPIIVWALTLYGKEVPPFEIITSMEWVTMVSLLVTTYFGASHYEKKMAITHGIRPRDLNQVVVNIKGSPGSNRNIRRPNLDNSDERSQDESEGEEESENAARACAEKGDNTHHRRDGRPARAFRHSHHGVFHDKLTANRPAPVRPAQAPLARRAHHKGEAALHAGAAEPRVRNLDEHQWLPRVPVQHPAVNMHGHRGVLQ